MTHFNTYRPGVNISMFYADSGFGELIFIETKSASHPLETGLYDGHNELDHFLDWGY